MTAHSRHDPTRTCVGCRQARPVRGGALARLGLEQGRLVLVGRERARPPGRGAWLCRSPACVQAAVKARAFSRAFRAEVRVSAVEDLLALVCGASGPPGPPADGDKD